jgi:hypothetical protein
MKGMIAQLQNEVFIFTHFNFDFKQIWYSVLRQENVNVRLVLKGIIWCIFYIVQYVIT